MAFSGGVPLLPVPCNNRAGDACLLVGVIWDEYMAKGLGVETEHRSALCEGNVPVLPLTSAHRVAPSC